MRFAFPSQYTRQHVPATGHCVCAPMSGHWAAGHAAACLTPNRQQPRQAQWWRQHKPAHKGHNCR